ncbi:MAG TPA: hypothetical protein VF077_13395 [Nitrospiraceae bacterium]
MTDALVTTYGNYSTALKELDEVDSRIIGLRDALAVEQPQKEIEKLAKALDSAIGWRKHCFSVYLGSLTKLQQRTSDKFPGMFKESGD